jgi:serine/threonine-protein kinase PknK
VRVIAATNRDLATMVAEGTFREDLFYRLHVVEAHLPPLRERLEDVPMLIDHFLKIFAARFRRDRKSVSREALRKMAGYSWPGNVRQLENVLLNAWVMSERPELGPEDLDLPASGRISSHDSTRSQHRAPSSPRAPARPAPASTRGAPPSSRSAPASSRSVPSSRATISKHGGRRKGTQSHLEEHKSVERERIVGALQACNWNRVKAAQMIGLPRRTFYRRLKEYGIQ